MSILEEIVPKAHLTPKESIMLSKEQKIAMLKSMDVVINQVANNVSLTFSSEVYCQNKFLIEGKINIIDVADIDELPVSASQVEEFMNKCGGGACITAVNNDNGSLIAAAIIINSSGPFYKDVLAHELGHLMNIAINSDPSELSADKVALYLKKHKDSYLHALNHTHKIAYRNFVRGKNLNGFQRKVIRCFYWLSYQKRKFDINFR